MTELRLQRLTELTLQRLTELMLQRLTELTLQRLTELTLQRLSELTLQRLTELTLQRLTELTLQRQRVFVALKHKQRLLKDRDETIRERHAHILHRDISQYKQLYLSHENNLPVSIQLYK